MNPEWAQARNILVMRLDNIGDVIMAGPVLRAIKNNLPDARVTLMASPGGAQATPLLPWADDVLVRRVLWQDLGRLEFDPGREWELVDTLAARAFDAAVILTSFSQTPHAPGLIAYLAGIPLRLGESKETAGGVLTHELISRPDEIHQVERNMGLIESVGFYVADRRLAVSIPGEARDAAQARLAGCGLPAGAPYVLLLPWASCPARTYHPHRFGAAARRLAEATGWPVAVAGAARDRDRAAAVLDPLGDRALDLVGETSIPELAALVAGARLVLTNDSLGMHLADATGTPGLVMYSGTEYESQWRPRHSPHRLLRRPTACSPCYLFSCPYHMECLEFSPEEVAAAALELLDINKQAP